MLKNNGKIAIQKNFLLCLCVICLIFTSFGLTVENSYAVDLNETLDDMGTHLDSDAKLENSQDNEILEGDNSDNGVLTAGSIKSFGDIKNLIDGAHNGDTIYLSGTYQPKDKKSQVIIDKSVTIIGTENTVLDGNHISSIFKITAPNVSVKNIKFINANGGTGSAIRISAKNVLIDNCAFDGNHISGTSGVVSGDYDLYSAENLRVLNCNFTNNNAYFDNYAEVAAGALGAYSMNTQVHNCIFESNWIKSNVCSYGGAIQIGLDEPNYYASISKCTFKYNKAISTGYYSHGGAGCVRNGVVYEDCVFIGNEADMGGALTLHASATIGNCDFKDNKAIRLYGGAISSGLLYDTMVLTIVDCNFEGNTAPLGGAIQAAGLNIGIINSDFKYNYATTFGGAVNIEATNVKVENSRFNGNSVGVDGGAIFIKGENTIVTESSFISNHALPDMDKSDDGLGGAIYINSTEASVMRNNFVFNTARNGSAIYFDKSGDKLIILDNIFYHNQAWVYHLPISNEDIYYGDTEEIKVVLYGGNNIGNYNNLAISNAIYNAADNDELDIDGQIPLDGARNDGKLYQDSREYNIPISLKVTHEDGTVVYDNSLNSSYLGEINVNLTNLKPGKYFVSAKHFEDNYYKGITNQSTFMVYPKVDNKITITPNKYSFNFEDVVIWTINITNLGPNNSTGVVAYNVVPDGLILLDHDFGNKFNPETGVLNISELAAGENLVYTMSTVIDKTGNITDKVNITAIETDVNLTNNYDEKTIHIDPACDLAVVKTVSNNAPNYPDDITWTITVSNNGPDIAHNVTVYDVLPSSLIYIGCDGDYDNNTGIWTIGTLDNGKTVRLNIRCKINRTGLTQNNVSVNGSEFDYDLTNNYDEELIYVNRAADLSIVKSVDKSNANYGDLVKWTLTISNKGPDNATNVIIGDVLPEGFIYIQSTVNFINNTLTINKINVGQTVTVDIITQVNITGDYLNIANVSSDEYDYNLTDNEDDEPITVNPASDLSVTKTASDSNPQYHDEITWEIVITNNGPDIAHNITVKDLLPESLIWIDDDSDGKYDPISGELFLEILDVGESFTFSIDTLVNATGSIENNVTVNGSEYDYNITNNKANETIEVEKSADVSIVKLVNESNPNYNDLITWTLIISNKGPDKANNIEVEDVLPEGLIYVSHNATKGILYEGKWVMCCLENGEEQRFELVTRINKTGKITNIATIHADEYDFNESNNIDNETIDVPLAVDVAVVINVNNTNPYFGEKVTWMISVVNNGPDNATGVELTDILPEGVIFVDYNSTKGPYDNEKWNIGSLNVGETQYLNITTISNALGEIINDAEVISKEYDWNKLNNHDDSKIDVKPVVDLAITKLADNPTPKYGQKVKWIITVTNKGPNNAHNVIVYEEIPEGLTVLKSNGNYDGKSWTVGNLNVGESKELKITCKVTSTGEIVNHVNVKSDEYDPDLSNNDANKSIIVPPASDLSITKIASKYDYKVGDVIEYRIEVVNNGPDTARNIKVREILDDLLKIKSFKASMGKFNKFALTWTIDSLGYGESAILYIKAIATGAGLVKNKVSVTSDTFDYDLSNNKDYAVVNVTEKPSDEPLNGKNNPNNNLDAGHHNILEKHATGNPFWNLVFVLLFSLIFLDGSILKKR
ncbi:MAG: DUF11 domain-containing protein [Methanobrevibacter sp.]|nr:DUF11 domain-containing protein [Methanobrevibacter sp.]